MKKEDLQRFNLPDNPGVYTFLGPDKEILYIGKATSLRSRVKSYFAPDLKETRGAIVVKMIERAGEVKWEATDSVLEAIILEANLIKKHQPPANVDDRDNKSFNYLVITREAYPRVLIVRGRELFQKWNKKDIKYLFGPFPAGLMFKEALRLVRAIFPFRDTCKPATIYGSKNTSIYGSTSKLLKKGKPCFNRQIGLCPGVCDGSMGRREYAQVIRNIGMLFSGKKKSLIANLKRDMAKAAKEERFEDAKEMRRQIGALTHIQDVSLIKRDAYESRGGDVTLFRIEAYDVAHTSGAETVGVMTVVEGGEPKKSDYRMFKVRGFKNDDTGALSEVLNRRLTHPEWPLPRLMVVDGGKNQLNAARRVLNDAGVAIPLVAVVKDEFHRPREIIGDEARRKNREREILLANKEAHRFALAYHRRRRTGSIIK